MKVKHYGKRAPSPPSLNVFRSLQVSPMLAIEGTKPIGPSLRQDWKLEWVLRQNRCPIWTISISTRGSNYHILITDDKGQSLASTQYSCEKMKHAARTIPPSSDDDEVPVKSCLSLAKGQCLSFNWEILVKPLSFDKASLSKALQPLQVDGVCGVHVCWPTRF